MALTLEELKKRAETNQKQVREQKKKHYALALELGFSPAEAKILRDSSEESIRRLATENK